MAQNHITRTVELDTETCLIAVVSDTHGRPHPALCPLLEQRRPSLILHAGDVGGLEVINTLEQISTTIYVRGNVDPTGPSWPDSASVRVQLRPTKQIEMALLHIAVARLRLNGTALRLLGRHRAQVVVFGHSHIPFLGMDGKVCLFNPGSAGPARWRLPTTMGFIDIGPDGLTFRHFDLRTGEEWKPGSQAQDTG